MAAATTSPTTTKLAPKRCEGHEIGSPTLCGAGTEGKSIQPSCVESKPTSTGVKFTRVTLTYCADHRNVSVSRNGASPTPFEVGQAFFSGRQTSFTARAWRVAELTVDEVSPSVDESSVRSHVRPATDVGCTYQSSELDKGRLDGGHLSQSGGKLFARVSNATWLSAPVSVKSNETV